MIYLTEFTVWDGESEIMYTKSKSKVWLVIHKNWLVIGISYSSYTYFLPTIIFFPFNTFLFLPLLQQWVYSRVTDPKLGSATLDGSWGSSLSMKRCWRACNDRRKRGVSWGVTRCGLKWCLGLINGLHHWWPNHICSQCCYGHQSHCGLGHLILCTPENIKPYNRWKNIEANIRFISIIRNTFQCLWYCSICNYFSNYQQSNTSSIIYFFDIKVLYYSAVLYYI